MPTTNREEARPNMPRTRRLVHRPEGKPAVHLCGALQSHNTDPADRPSNGVWTLCNTCGWVHNEPMLVTGSGFDPATHTTDIGAQKFWCVRCGGDLP